MNPCEVGTVVTRSHAPSTRVQPSVVGRVGAVLTLAVVLASAGCRGSDDDTSATSGPVCGLVDPALAADVIGSDEFSTKGSGAIPESKRRSGGADCTIRRHSGAGPNIQVRLGEVASPHEWADRLRAEAEDPSYGDPAATYTGDRGTGYGVTYDSGIYALGAGVNLLKDDRVIRVTVYQWPDATPGQRLEAARKIAIDADANLTAYDTAHAS